MYGIIGRVPARRIFVAVFLAFVVGVVGIFGFTSQVWAQAAAPTTTGQAADPTSTSDRLRDPGTAAYGIPEVNDFSTAVEACQNGNLNQECFTGNVTTNTAAAVYCSIVPCSESFLTATGRTPALASVGTGITKMFEEKPADTGAYIAYVMNNAGINYITPQAYAQGLGFSALNPILSTWVVFRNIAYLGFVIIFLVIGFMIMFRQKIGSQTAVTAQQAIPRIIIALLAVTFSYAIAGLMIDAMYLMMFLIINVFGGAAGEMNNGLNISDALDWNIIQLGGALLSGKGNAAETIFGAATSVGDIVNDTLGGGVVAAPISWLSSITFALVLAIAFLFVVVQIFFELLKTYVTIILSIVLAPIVLMMGALPGNNSFSTWIRGLIANLAVFPVVLMVLTTSFLLQDQMRDSGGFAPPFIGGNTPQADSLITLVGIAMAMVLPEIIKNTKKALGGGEGIFGQYANAFGSALKKGWTGGELVPGVAFTDTRKIGLSGKTLGQTGAAVGGTVAGAVPGTIQFARQVRGRGFVTASETFLKDAFAGGRAAADLTGAELYKTQRKERQDVSFATPKAKLTAYREGLPKKP
jgi:hypothetical protein